MPVGSKSGFGGQAKSERATAPAFSFGKSNRFPQIQGSSVPPSSASHRRRSRSRSVPASRDASYLLWHTTSSFGTQSQSKHNSNEAYSFTQAMTSHQMAQSVRAPGPKYKWESSFGAQRRSQHDTAARATIGHNDRWRHFGTSFDMTPGAGEYVT